MPSATALPSQPLDLVLHIGSGRCGSSSVQAFLAQNRARLAELGWLYPTSPGRRRHARLSLFVQPDRALAAHQSWRWQRTESPKAFRGTFRRRLVGEIEASGLNRVLMSDEALYGSREESLHRLRRLTGRIARSVRLVVYLRRQDDHLVSRYQQAVKEGDVRRLAERTQRLDLARIYDHHARLTMWERTLKPDALVVRRFEPERFAGGSLYQDFLGAAGIDAHAEEMEQGPRRNASLDAESVELLRILNILRRERPDVAATLPPGNRPLFMRLAAVSTGPVLTLPGPFLDDFMSRWEESNRRVAQEFLGDDAGELFRSPRKTAGTTTKQYLDPDRLDHFLTVLELPEPLHAPLRELVEREAKAH